MRLNDFRLPTLRTCASIPHISVPGIANTAVWAKSIVALRAYVTHWKRSGAFVNIWKREKKQNNIKGDLWRGRGYTYKITLLTISPYI